jgi:hypothetical protein
MGIPYKNPIFIILAIRRTGLTSFFREITDVSIERLTVDKPR